MNSIYDLCCLLGFIVSCYILYHMEGCFISIMVFHTGVSLLSGFQTILSYSVMEYPHTLNSLLLCV